MRGLLAIFVLVACYQLVTPIRVNFKESSDPTTYENPVVDANCPDPGVIYNEKDGRYYVATTTDDNSVPNKFPIRVSDDLVNWTQIGYIFSPSQHNMPVWATMDFWAPEIHYIVNSPSNTPYVVYYVARDTTGVLCVGAATSASVTGPFTDIGKPLIRNSTMGNIDPNYFFDPATNAGYLFWKEDGNGANPPEEYTPIWVQPLSPDGLAVVGSKTLVLENDPDSWEGPLVEAPWVIEHNGYYYLFYSANYYASTLYAVGVARATSVLGPYEKFEYNPIVHSDQYWSGPGHNAVLQLPPTFTNLQKSVNSQESASSDGFFMMYHSWVGDDINTPYPRVLMLDSVYWNNSWPYLLNYEPSDGVTPVPSY